MVSFAIYRVLLLIHRTRAVQVLVGLIVLALANGLAYVLQLGMIVYILKWIFSYGAMPHELAPYLVDKGSITVDGVSLTVVHAGEDAFTVSLIPETLARTTLGTKQPGDPVNLEVDVIAKYVERLLDHQEERP